MREIVCVSFAGGGGSCEGARMALGRSPDVAINHSAKALAMHRLNHPETRHYCEDVWVADPREVADGCPVGLAWFSPDCTDFSKSKNGKPKNKKIRGLAWVALKWARTVRPRVIIVENVEEFEGWGPLDDNGMRVPEKIGLTFRQWVGRLRALGYVVEWRNLIACDYGAPTNRKRLFIIARCDGQPIVWPSPTHGPGCAKPWRTAAEIIDWSIPTKSIFERARPLAGPTLARIAHGIHRYVLGASRPYIVGNAARTMIHSGNGERDGQSPRVYDLRRPLGTVVAQGCKHALISAFITKHYGGVVGHDVHRPLGTVTTQDHHALTTAALDGGDHEAEAKALLDAHAPARSSQPSLLDMFEPREPLRIYDIHHRMLQPRELFRAQGFPDSWRIDVEHNGKLLGSTDLIALAGNSVPPHVAAALIRANYAQAQEVAA